MLLSSTAATLLRRLMTVRYVVFPEPSLYTIVDARAFMFDMTLQALIYIILSCGPGFNELGAIQLSPQDSFPFNHTRRSLVDQATLC
jgi:hypothetical protein